MDKTKNSNDYVRGLKDGIPIGIGYIPLTIACGIAASKAGLNFFISQLLAVMIYSGSGQATAIKLFESGETSILMYALTLFVMNCRYMLFSISLSQRLHPSTSMLQKIIVGFFNTDEVFAVAVREKGYITSKYFLGVATIPYICFAVGNVLGFCANDLLPHSVSSALGIMLFAMFIALIVPAAKESKPVLNVVLIAFVLSVILECIPVITKHLTSGWIIIICAIVTSLIGAWLFPVSEEEKEGA